VNAREQPEIVKQFITSYISRSHKSYEKIVCLRKRASCSAQTILKQIFTGRCCTTLKGGGKMLKELLLLAAAGAALGGGTAYAGNGPRDVYTDGASVMGPRDPYTDGGRAITDRRDVYTDGAKITDRRDGFTDGA